eukprot:7448540-Karenia_brevis.AAC.1
MKDVELSQAQNLKKSLFNSDSHAQHDLGDLSAAVAPHVSIPGPRLCHKGFFAVSTIRRQSNAKGKDVAYVTLVATTRTLMKRFASRPICQLDGGFKYNIM